MSKTRHQHFRSFLTERFTAVAVEIFEEVESILQAYYEENKSLRNILNMVLSPEIKLPRIDVRRDTGAPADVREEPRELNTQVDLEISEPLPKKTKEEQIEYDISCESEQQQQGLEEAYNVITSDCVKNDPEEERDSNMDCITDTHHSKVEEQSSISPATLSDDEREDCSSLDSDALSICPQLSMSEESTSQSRDSQQHDIKSKKKMAARRSKVPVWDYFVEIAPGKAQCGVCNKVLSMGSSSARMKNTSNLWAHLKHCHLGAYSDALKKKCGSQRKSETLFAVPQLFDRQIKWTASDPRAEKMDKAILEMIATDDQPFTVVSDIGFEHLKSLAEPRYNIKDEEFCHTQMLDETYAEVVTKVKTLITPEEAPYMAFTTDCWSGTTESLMSLSGHFIHRDWNRQQVVLNVKTMTGSHTAQYIQQTFLEILDSWKINPERVVLVLRDGGANMVKGMRLMELPDVSCAAHTLQLVINDGLSSQRAVLDIIDTLKGCAAHFCHSVLAKQRLIAIQEKLGLPKNHIIQAVQTCWHSTLHMLQRLYEQRRALTVYAREHGHISCHSAAQWDIVSNLIETLEPLEEVTLEISHSESSASCVIPTVSVLKLMLQQEGSSPAGIRILRQTMLDSLTRRFSKVEDAKCLVLATVLDPRFKGKAFTSAETLEKAKEWLKEEAAHHMVKTVEETGQTEDTAKRQRAQTEPNATLVDSLYLKLLGAAQHTSEAQSSFKTELECYLKEPVVERSTQPLEWWKSNEGRLHRLAALARKYLCLPPSTVPSERVLSEVGILYDKWRSHLSEENADKLYFLHYNMRLLNWNNCFEGN